MIGLTEEMRELIDNNLANGTPCVLATTSSTGELGIGLRGSMMVWDDESLAFWEWAKGRGLQHMEEHGQVAVLFNSPAHRRSWKLFGRAQIHREGPLREQVLARVVQWELDRDPERQGFAVIVHLDRVENLGGTVLMQREEQPAEGP